MEQEQKTPDLSGILANVMGNPQAMAMFSSLLGDIGKAKQSPSEDCPLHCANEECTERKPLAPPCAATAAENRKRLLMALKPYLSPERVRALDRILMIADALTKLRAETRH